MTRPLAILWLIVTLLPFAYFGYFISFLASAPMSHGASPEQFELLFRWQLMVILGTWVLLATYIVYIFKTHYVPKDKKALWAVVIFLGNMFAMPIFWYLHVWRPLSMRARDAA